MRDAETVDVESVLTSHGSSQKAQFQHKHQSDFDQTNSARNFLANIKSKNQCFDLKKSFSLDTR